MLNDNKEKYQNMLNELEKMLETPPVVKRGFFGKLLDAINPLKSFETKLVELTTSVKKMNFSVSLLAVSQQELIKALYYSSNPNAVAEKTSLKQDAKKVN